MTQEKIADGNIFLKLHPIHRLLISLAFSIAVYFIVLPLKLPALIVAMLLWNVFAIAYLLLCWIVLLKRPVSQIRQLAKNDDGSVLYVYMLIVISSFASMVTVLLLVISKNDNLIQNVFYIPDAIAGILLSWIMVHTIYTFHYAHLYYGDSKKFPGKDSFGLEFPGNEAEKYQPDYLDFAYFAFVIGCTFQVSDIEISSPTIRRIVLGHGLISFCLNTFVVALTINLIAGLSK
ncbi:MAG: DUF1345 domain-containing protein [Bacteroidetes bacterium]|nr:DUF1345 domain-containing protein [Bacteroidota bacterium]